MGLIIGTYVSSGLISLDLLARICLETDKLSGEMDGKLAAAIADSINRNFTDKDKMYAIHMVNLSLILDAKNAEGLMFKA